MPQLNQPQPPDQFGLPQGFTPQVQSTQPPNAPYYGFQPPAPLPSISSYQPTLGTQLAEQLWRTITGNFPGAEAIPQAGTTIFPNYSKLEQVLAGKMPSRAPAQQVRGIVQGGGVKPEEVEYSGVESYLQQNPAVEREKLIEHIRQKRPKLETSQRGGYENPERLAEIKRILASDQRLTDREAIALNVERQQLLGETGYNQPTKFEQYTLPGGERYREILVTMPYEKKGIGEMREGKKLMETLDRERAASPVFSSGHFDEPNVLAHLRVNDRVTPDGKQVLFVEEVQSDWHQKGRQEGYKSTQKYDKVSVVNEGGRFIVKGPEGQTLGNYGSEVAANERADAMRGVQGGVPDAPYKKSWPLLAMKQALAEAAKEGKDYVAWTTGAQQAERYDLSKQVSRVYYLPETQTLRAMQHDGSIAIEQTVPKERVADYIGKDAAEKLFSKKLTEVWRDRNGVQQGYDLQGADLKVGGEGMSSFYDKELVNELNKYAKQWGVKVEQITIPTVKAEEPSVVSGGRKFRGVEGKVEVVHALPITPRMREDILGKGQPLFQIGGAVAGTALADKLAQPREQTLEQREKATHLTRLGREES